MTVGVDEVGRGSWAGPVCVAAVAWPDSAKLKGLNDSKKIPPKKRIVLAQSIRELAACIGIGWATPAEVDKLGLTGALRQAAQRAVEAVSVDFEKLIIDGNLPLIKDSRAVLQVKADTTVPAVMAASIIAKVARDTYMQALDTVHSNYQFAKNVGYGTSLHASLLQQFGPCAAHRFSFAPVKAAAQ